MSNSFEYVFPAIRGLQANKEYYVSMCPLKLIPKIFIFNEEELIPELRAQRILNRTRLPVITKYILSNRDDYTFSAITASIDSEVRFEPMGGDTGDERLGSLHVPMTARFIINDGQHRRAAIEMALKENPDLADETIAVVFFLDHGLERCQQMFADLNRHAIRPSKSLGVLYDHRDEHSRLARTVISRAVVFRNLVDMEHSTLSLRSTKLFTLSSIYNATSVLLADLNIGDFDEQVALASQFWIEVGKQFPEWEIVRQRKMPASEVRKEFLHSHGIALQALGRVGNVLLKTKSKWSNSINKISELDWSRSNGLLWEGRAMIGGRVSKANQNVTLTTNALKKHLGLELVGDELVLEEAFLRGEKR